MLDPAAVAKQPWRIRRVLRRPWAAKWRLALGPLARRRLRRFLNAQGHVTPNFTWHETRSGDGKPVPPELRRNAIRHAWNLERFRHRVGAPIGLLSWYRSPEHNKRVGGASQSKHMEALATDLRMPLRRSDGTAVPRRDVMAAADAVWPDGGVGDYPSGAVHVDSRAGRARWSSF